MALIKAKPTSPGRRFVVKVVNPDLHKGAPHAPLLDSKSKKGGRNNTGRITTRHKGGGHKQHYRIVDFKRNKDSIPGEVERIEYDPNRSANIALIKYADGERRYIIAPKGVEKGAAIQSGQDAPIKPGNCLPLRNIPVGTVVHWLRVAHFTDRCTTLGQYFTHLARAQTQCYVGAFTGQQLSRTACASNHLGAFTGFSSTQ